MNKSQFSNISCNSDKVADISKTYSPVRPVVTASVLRQSEENHSHSKKSSILFRTYSPKKHRKSLFAKYRDTSQK
jgi:hypothetical protein